MARQIIILGQTAANPREWQVAFWIPVKAAHQSRYARVGAVSVVPDATAPENAAIADGSIREIVDVCAQADGANIAAVGADLVARWNTLKATQDADPWGSYFGTYYDGTWHVDQSKA